MKYLDSNCSIEVRVNDLLSRMNVFEKAAQLCCIWPMVLVGSTFPDPEKMKKYMQNGLGRMTQFANMVYRTNAMQVADLANSIQKFVIENTRLKIPVLFQNEALSGFMCVDATSFPTPQNLASTWKPELIEALADIIRKEMVAVGVRQALAPVLDITTDPRWGRVHETFGEDPYLASSMGVAFTKGLQGKDLRDGVISTGKHFLGYGSSQGGLNQAAIRLNPQELFEVYGRPFESAIRLAGLKSIMVTYCEINGIPAGANKEIIREWLYGRMGFNGHVVSEGGGFNTFVERYHIAKDYIEAAVIGLEAGSDADTPISMAYTHLPEAIRKGLIKEELLNEAVTRVLSAKFQLGIFEKPFVDTGRVYEIYNQPQSERLSKKIAEESIVLLTNKENFLPLISKYETIAVIGPHANCLRAIFPNYSFPASIEMLKGIIDGFNENTNEESQKKLQDFPKATVKQLFKELFEIDKDSIDDLILNHFPDSKTLINAIKERVGPTTHVLYSKGCDITDQSIDGFEEAIKTAEKSDLVIMAMGDKSSWIEGTCGEGKDSTILNFPGVQEKLIKGIYATGKPIVLVLFNGRPYANPWIYENMKAVLIAGFPGPGGAKAVTGVLFGDINPGGKLVMTIPRSVGQIPIFYYHKEGSGYKLSRMDKNLEDIFSGGYINEERTPLFPFGFGLSYTNFEFSDIELNQSTIHVDSEIKISCRVKNTGKYLGDEVVQLYIHDEEARVTRPLQELIGFKRITLNPSESCKVVFTVKMNQLGFFNENKKFVVQPGKMKVMIGSSSDDLYLNAEFLITGDEKELIGKRDYLSNVVIEQ